MVFILNAFTYKTFLNKGIYPYLKLCLLFLRCFVYLIQTLKHPGFISIIVEMTAEKQRVKLFDF